MFTFVSLPSHKNDQNKLQTYTFMKERLILFCMLLLCGIGVSLAQSGNAKDFDQKKEEAIVQKLQQAVNEKNYKEAEKNGKAFDNSVQRTRREHSEKVQLAHTVLLLQFSLLPILVKEKR